jgi:hypothetical protein
MGIAGYVSACELLYFMLIYAYESSWYIAHTNSHVSFSGCPGFQFIRANSFPNYSKVLECSEISILIDNIQLYAGFCTISKLITLLCPQ